jgi:hypothetical protein
MYTYIIYIWIETYEKAVPIFNKWMTISLAEPTNYTLPIPAIRDLGMQRNSFTVRNQQNGKTCGIIIHYPDHDHGHR